MISSRAVYFCNNGILDMDAVRIMGVSAKETQSPIGRFGTGLKYAIAVLLRTGHAISIKTTGDEYALDLEPRTIRGRAFQAVVMYGPRGKSTLPFTSELGKDWNEWQAYRELHSNCLDEGGTIIGGRDVFDNAGLIQQSEVVICVTGEPVVAQYTRRHEIFLQTKPIATGDGIEVHPNPRDGGGGIYYRGVLAGATKEPTLYAYNLTCDMALSEDRNFSSMWDVEWQLRSRIPTLTDRGVLDAELTDGAAWDQNLDLSAGAASDEFHAAALDAAKDGRASERTRQHAIRSGKASAILTPVEPTKGQAAIVAQAIGLVRRFDADTTV